MGIEVTVSVPIDKDILREKLAEIRQAFEAAVSDEVTRMVTNASQGKQADGTGMTPYSDGYRKRREAAGYQGDPPNLAITGDMLAAMTYEMDPNEEIAATLKFTSKDTVYTGKRGFGSTRTANTVDKARWNNRPGREFFKLTNEALERIRRRIAEAAGNR